MFSRLLVAIDTTASSLVALGFATGLARRSGASVHVLHVDAFLAGGQALGTGQPRAAEVVRSAVRQLREEGLEATGSLIHGTGFSLAQIVATVAANRGCDAIVLGSRRRPRGRLRSRGVRERVVSLSSLPVLVAPPPLQFPGRRKGAPEAAVVRVHGNGSEATPHPLT